MSELLYEKGLVGSGKVPAPKKKRRPADSPDFLAGPVAGNASVNRPAKALPAQLAPEDRLAATGETTVGWLTRRYGMVMDSGWDPQQVPLTVIHDLATSGVDDQQLARVLRATSPLQERLTSRLLGPGGVQGQAGVGVEASGVASPLPRPQQAGLGINAGDLLHGLRHADAMGALQTGLNWPWKHLIGPIAAVPAQYVRAATADVVAHTPESLGLQAYLRGDGVDPNMDPAGFINRKVFGIQPGMKRPPSTEMPSFGTAWRRAKQSGLGGALAEFSGRRPGDPDYEQQAQLLDTFGAFVLDPLIVAGKLNQGRKLAKSLPVTGATADLLDKAGNWDKLTGRLIGSGGDAPRSRLATAVYQMMAKRPEALVETPKARKAIDDIAAAVSPNYLADRYRFRVELAETLAKESDPVKVSDWIVAGMKGYLPSFEHQWYAGRVARNTDRFQGLEADVLAGKIPQETAKPMMDALALDTIGLEKKMTQGYQIGHYVRNVPTATLGGWARQVVKRGMEKPGQTVTVGGASDEVLAAADEKISGLKQRLIDDAAPAVDEPAGLEGDALRRYRENRLTSAMNEQAARQEQNLGSVTLPGSRVQQALHPGLQALNWAYSHAPNLRGLFEMLPSQGGRIEVMDKTAGRVHLERIGQLLRIPRNILDEHLDRYINASGPQEVSVVYRDLMREAKKLPPEMREELTRLHQQSSDSLYHVAGGGVKQELHAAKKLYKGDVVEFGQPQLSSELLSYLPTPDVNGIRDALSLSGRGRRWLQQARALPQATEQSLLDAAGRFPGVNPKYLTMVLDPLNLGVNKLGRAVAKSWADDARALTTFTRAIWKPAVLLRFGFTGRQLGEEHVAMAAAGLPGILHPVQFLRSARGTGEFARWAEVPDDILMNYARDEMGKAPTGKYVLKGTNGYSQSWRAELKQIQAAREARELLEHIKLKGDGPEAVDATVDWLRNHPEGRDVWAQHEAKEVDVYHYSRKGLDADPPTPDELEEVRRQWVEGIQKRVADKTNGNQQLLKLVRDGELRMSVDEYAKLKFSGQLPDGVEDALGELNTYSQGNLGPAFPPFEVRAEVSEKLGAEVTLSPEGKPLVKVSLDDPESAIPFLDSLPNDLKPTWVKGTGYEAVGGGPGRGFVDKAFHFIAGMPLNKASRMPAYRQFASGEYNRLVAAGWNETKATELASKYAVQQMKHLMFDLGEKSLFNEQMAVLSPFMNAWQQAGRRYFLDIPGRQGFGIGQAAFARKGQLMLETAKAAGWVREDEQGTLVTHIPGLDAVLRHVTDIPFKTDFPLSRFTMLGQTSPGIGPVPMVALVNLPGIREQWDKPGPLHATLDILQPFGPEGSVGPAWMNRVWMGAFRQPPPWEVGHSAEYQKYLYEGSVGDAIRLLDAKEGKDTGTTRLERIGAMPESREKTAEVDKFLREANSMARHVFFARGVSGAVLPAQPNLIWPNQEEANALKTKLNALGDNSAARQKLISEFLADKPYLSGYLVPKSRETPFGEGLKPMGSKFDGQQYWSEVRTGARERLTPEETIKYGAGAVSYHHIQAQYHDRVDAAGTTAKERLENWALVKEANRLRANAITTLRNTNPEWASQHDIQVASAKEKAGKPTAVWQEQLAQDLYYAQAQVESKLAEIDPEGDLNLEEFGNIRRKLLDQLEANPWATSQPGVDGEVARYWRDVAEPYYQQLDGLYEQAKTLPHGERAPIYEKIRDIKNGFKAPRGMPSPEEVAFAGLPKKPDPKAPGMANQADQVAKWSTQPPGWLTDFQRKQLGMPVGEAVSQYWTVVNQAEQTYRKWREDNNISPSSTDWRNARQTLDQWKYQLASANGLQSELVMEQVAPFERAWASNQLTGPEWQPVRQLVTTANKALAAASTSPDGAPAGIDSQYGMQLMDWFEGAMVQQLQANPSLVTSMERWGKIMSPDDPLVGRDLLRRFLFGTFR